MDKLDEKSCRVCLNYDNIIRRHLLSDLYKNGNSISETISFFFHIDIDEFKQFESICQNCLDKIDSVNEIYQDFVSANGKLQELLQSSSSKEDDDEEGDKDPLPLLEVKVEITELDYLKKEVTSPSPERDENSDADSDTDYEANSSEESSDEKEEKPKPKKAKLIQSENVEEKVGETSNSSKVILKKVKIKNWTAGKQYKTKCYICTTLFETRQEYEKHVMIHKDLVPYTCPLCNMVLRRPSGVSRHMMFHDETDRPFACEGCTVRFTTPTALNRHIKLEHSGPKPVKVHKIKRKRQKNWVPGNKNKTKCYICSTIFETKDELETHFFDHVDILPFTCPICKLICRRASATSNHLKLHDETDRPFECTECPVRFLTPWQLNVHKKYKHQGEQLPYDKKEECQCSHCGKIFQYKRALKFHENTHTNEMKEDCPICKKTFSSKKNVRRHMLIHTQEKAFVCEYCNRAFRQTTHLKDHLRTHTGERPFQCQFCDKAFINRSVLKHHEKSHMIAT